MTVVARRSQLATPSSRAGGAEPGLAVSSVSPIKPLDNRRSCIRFHPEIQGRTTRDEAEYLPARSSGTPGRPPARGRDLSSPRERKRPRPG